MTKLKDDTERTRMLQKIEYHKNDVEQAQLRLRWAIEDYDTKWGKTK